MALRFTQFLTEMNTRNILGGKARPVPKAGNLTSICEPIVWKSSTSHNHIGLHGL
jgi:hypothetical protein